MAAQHADPFAQYKAAQREAWASFLPVEVITTIPAANLVKFAQVSSGQTVLDVACGTGVVAVTAARRGATVSGLDLSPVLLERARYNADLAGVTVDFAEGDAEALAYPDASFDVVLSQFGHIFAPRPQSRLERNVAGAQGRRPSSHFELAARALPGPHVHFAGATIAAACRHSAAGSAGPLCGDPPPCASGWRRRGRSISTLGRGTLTGPALSLTHFRVAQEKTIGPLGKIVASLENDAAKLAKFRAEFEAMASEARRQNNAMRMPFLMTRATKA